MHANGPYTITLTLDDLDNDCLHAVIFSYCSFWFDLCYWLCALIYFRFDGLNYYPNYLRFLVYYSDSFHFPKAESVLCSQMCIVYSHRLHFFLELLLIRKCFEYILKVNERCFGDL